MSASLAPECNELKERYDSCFLKWYSEKFLRGNSSNNDCEKVFEEYKKCLSKTLKDRGIDTMLEDARKNSKENDEHHMKRSYVPRLPDGTLEFT
ncbi:Mitochondrial distribution and morphology protein 35 [Coccidioides posadasii str. Silveira]|uniref:Mitochondrial distribution and morphology protein 35 n=1 Tax=Coccidioides posadasii (strain RMSCC 757 / Silveira) TaxID=443226 RepID=UPI001BF09DC9|nr:Mitochondrial distribution and morphology protein 35 [Coccidioides posadasii str. Silveira]